MKRQKFLSQLTDEQLHFLMCYWPFWARQDQCPPDGEWRVWLMLGGRGAGKTRAGAEWIRTQVEGCTPLSIGRCQHIALVGETISAVREVMIDGPSGIRPISPPETRPDYIASRKILVWPNGAKAQVFSAYKPDALRGPQFDAAWCDELAKWRYDRACWDMLQFGLRLGNFPRQVVTTTPQPTQLIRDLIKDPSCHVSRASSHVNRAHLAPGFLEELMRRYEGTRLGRQEIDAELLDDISGALWSPALISAHRVETSPPLIRKVMAIDPPCITGPKADACGIVIAGCDSQHHGYVLADETVSGLSPARWAQKVAALYDTHKVDCLVAEINQGGDLIREIVLRYAPHIHYRPVRALRGKLLRAEPVAALYERGFVHHVGLMKYLEQEMCRYDGRGQKSPDRMDALVWALTDLLLTKKVDKKPQLRRL